MSKKTIASSIRAYNPNYYKDPISKNIITLFSGSLNAFIKDIKTANTNHETEEFIKNVINQFLKNNFYSAGRYQINTDQKIDSTIKSDGSLRVIIETKKSDNRNEMTDENNINRKALWELVFYYLEATRDTTGKRVKRIPDTEIRRLIATDGLQWFIFDANDIERFCDGELEQHYYKYKNNQLSYARDTSKFYADIKAFFEKINITEKLDYLYFNLEKADVKQVYKAFYPTFLLKEKYTGESHARPLNKKFYQELLYIMGLKEETSKGKTLINIDPSIKNSFADQLYRKFHDDKERSVEEATDKTFELIIIWLDRFLFIKLFEGQLISINGNDEKYKILSNEKIKSFNDVQNLFFNVLGKKDRDNTLFYQQFNAIPYLNSSLFEKQPIEINDVNINDLHNDNVPLKSDTVLPKNKKTEIPLLQYTIDFLNSYIFGAVESDDGVYQKNSDIIDASVLGLIFEKINGYKDGSFYTPSTITQFMTKNVIEKTVIQKFNDAYKWDCQTVEDARFKLQLQGNINLYKQANEIINSIHICDPSVGSGHFLVSALNQLIYIKSRLGIIFVNGTNELLRDCDIYVQDDVLMVTDAQGNPFQYHKESKASQRIQETLFNEKRNIIEHCLFGVDMNDKAVQICRLRLWIELLKNAYYKNNVMETLPNIDINIKTGNSLFSKMPCTPGQKIFNSNVTAEMKRRLQEYKHDVDAYRHESSKDRKKDIRRRISAIKELVYTHTQQLSLFKQYETKDKIYRDSFDWGIEFPDLLTDDYIFTGFDIVVMNPPYIQLQTAINDTGEKLGDRYADMSYETFAKTGDIYCLFFERAIEMTVNHGYDAWICSDKWMKAGYGKATRQYLASHGNMLALIEVGAGVFEAATVNTEISFYQKVQKKELTYSAKCLELNGKSLQNLTDSDFVDSSTGKKGDPIIILPSEAQEIIKKMQKIGTPLSNWDISINRGIVTGLNDAFIISGEKKDELIAEDSKSAEIIKPILRGMDIKRYVCNYADLWLIATFPSMHYDINEYTAIKEYLLSFGIERLEQTGARHVIDGKEIKSRKKTSNKWFEVQDSIGYWKEFSKTKIVWGNLCRSAQFAIADKDILVNAPSPMITPGNKYLLAVLNSKLGDWYVRQFGVERNGGYFEYKPMFVEKLPVPEIPKDNQQKFIDVVDRILTAKKNGEDTLKMEDLLDQMVFKLYKLTDKEIEYLKSVK